MAPADPGTARAGLRGDGESPPNFTDRAQNLGVPQGKLLRIDTLGRPAPDNPDSIVARRRASYFSTIADNTSVRSNPFTSHPPSTNRRAR